MAARTTREAARKRITAAFHKALDRVIPADDSQPLQGRTFIEWEDQADEFDRAVTSTLLEERAALEDTAEAEKDQLGLCPHCGSNRLYLPKNKQPKNKTIRGPHGDLVLAHQSLRCRACGRSFSPSSP